MYSPPYTKTYTYDQANQLGASTIDGKTTNYKYDAAGRMVQAGSKTYRYKYLDKVAEVREDGKVIAAFEYTVEGQVSIATYGDKTEEFMWDGLALIKRNDISYINEPYVTGGNPILADNDVMFNDMLGNTVAINGKSIDMTAFGETENTDAMFTGKPHVAELGYAFLFRNYDSSLGKWSTADPLGYPDGWNNFAYCNNSIIALVDPIGCFWEEVTQIATGIVTGAGAGVGAIVGSVVPGVGTAAGAMAGAITGAISGAISALSNCIADPPQSYADAVASGALDGLFAGSVAGMSPAGPVPTMVAGIVSGVLSAGVSSNWDTDAMIVGGILGGAYGYGGNAGNDALLNNILSANGIAVTNVVLGYMELFNDFFPVNLREVRAVNE